ncbi:DUF1904 domain-containing protein [Bdellovibrio sp. SKB1291214]|uniref:DUF1904 domain-containing protein n=1 Tax=Bdellovibrio sp. SKB1291214 TaxID=1732569 RepID=UPI000B517AC1|nr:DUF1904 domain-containing protein [Bdellovibrio sp. SKB1291214]UYL09522.1 DUF1904 domain-containing protein [Bdellovibrio sp. SKB1291214]
MPHLRFRGLKEDQVASLSQTLVKDLAAAIETGEDNFSFELIGSHYFSKGQPGGAYPFVEVLWFKRSQEIQDKSALIITEQVKKLCPQDDVAVIFVPLEKNAYYENGSHF